jgi:hypothetical protein
MAGGIQKGTEAGSAESKQLDGDVKVIAEAIAQAQNRYYYESGHRCLDETKNFSHQTVIEAAIPEMRERKIRTGCMPDGGMWFDAPRNQTRSLQVAFEAKHQQDGGNAIERWCKNYLLCNRLWPDAKYVTFMTGEGARVGGVLHAFGETMSAVNGPNCIFYYSPAGFSQEDIFSVMNSVLDLGLTFDQIRPYINKRLVNNFGTLFEVETPEQREARLAAVEERLRIERQFSEFAQDPTDPIYPVWHRIPKDDKPEAHDIALDMLQEGVGNAQIATELVECFLKR